ncbi:dynein regulatory complex subunit 2-like [Corythoichthys intestinalis]|uniref:dynein regulatory complex subunit 2-like n=1 Tax=Corythoichthys intestinalis TaxID=161448 RepID=UPI0025A557CD|nr:dynein regulatory complex subunit 2-like [Corythoichthys intestinalis]XP_061798724.1 dynein regulatory complex subunit 2-like [Nerophis lumbriciformis]
MPRKGKKAVRASSWEEEQGEEPPQRRQHLKQQQDEANKKREELLNLFLTVKVRREQQNSRVNRAKIDQVWRNLLRQARSQQLRDDIIILRQTFERQLDALDDVIKNLSGDLEEAERQCARTHRLHLQHAERLRTLLDERAAFVRRRWEESLRDVCRCFAENRNHTAAQTERQRGDLEDAAFILSRQHEDVTRAIRAAYNDAIAARRTGQRDRVAALRSADAEKLEEKRRQVRDSKQDAEYVDSPAQLLMARNQRLICDISKDVSRVKKLQGAVADLRGKLCAFQTETASSVDLLTNAKTAVTVKTRSLREDLTRARQASRKRLSVLAIRTDDAVQKLRAVIAKGEKVLNAAAICGKIQDTTSSSQGGDDELQGAAEPTKTFPEILQLTRRLNAALLRRSALTRHTEQLRADNRQLKVLIRGRLDGMTLGGSRTLLSVEVAPTTDGPAHGASRHNVIEAKDAVKKSLMYEEGHSRRVNAVGF